MAIRALILLTALLKLAHAAPGYYSFIKLGDDGEAQSSNAGGAVTVDCSNREAVRLLMDTNTKFRCGYPKKWRPASVVPEAEVAAAAFPPQVHDDSVAKCATAGQYYDSNRGICVSQVMTPAFTSASQRNTAEEIASSKCDGNEVFDAVLNSCVNVKRKSPYRAGRLVRGAGECGVNGFIIPEIGICGFLSPPKVLKPIVADSLVRERAEPVPVQQNVACEKNEKFVPEIGICTVTGKPSKNPTAPPSASLIRKPVKLEIRAFEVSKSLTDCAPGSVFAAEIGICFPVI